MNKNNYIKSKKAFSLVEVLAAMAIFTVAIIASVSVMINAAKSSVNNDLRSNAETLGVRVLEILKKPDGQLLSCGQQTNPQIFFDRYYSVGDINTTSNSSNIDSMCLQQHTVGEITTCNSSSSFFVDKIFPNNYTYSNINDEYCVQVSFQDLPESEYEQIKVRVIYKELTEDNIIIDLYGLNRELN